MDIFLKTYCVFVGYVMSGIQVGAGAVIKGELYDIDPQARVIFISVTTPITMTLRTSNYWPRLGASQTYYSNERGLIH